MRKPVCLSVSVKFLSTFCKATGLSPTVRLELTDKKPMLVEYSLGEVGYVRFYLAPKIGDDE
jgi:proliferating cell nuclear antigen